MEGNVYTCSWKKSKGIYRLVLTSIPELAVESADFSEAEELLADRICERFGDGEAVLRFDPPPPRDELRSWTQPEIFLLGYNERVESNAGDPEIYSSAKCPKCGYARGDRTDRPIKVKKSIRSNIAWAEGSRPVILLFSEAFIDCLDPRERETIQFKPVEMPPKSKKNLFELTGRPIISFVGFRDATYNPLTSWQCSVCGRIKLFPFHQRFWGTAVQYFVSRTDLPQPLPGLFVAGSARDGLRLCVTTERWKTLKQSPATKGIVTRRLGIVAKPLVVRQPPITADYPTPRSQL